MSGATTRVAGRAPAGGVVGAAVACGATVLAGAAGAGAFGRTVVDAAVGLRPARVANDEQAAAAYQRARRRGYGRSVALMATGGAAVVLGALAGGDAGGVLILGGAVVGLIGLYDYLR